MVSLSSNTDSSDDARDVAVRLGVPITRCLCNKVVAVYTSWCPANPGRRFVSCRHKGKPDGCELGEWYDPEFTERSVSVINELISTKEMLLAKNAELMRALDEKGFDIMDLSEELVVEKEESSKRQGDLKACVKEALKKRFMMRILFMMVSALLIVLAAAWKCGL